MPDLTLSDFVDIASKVSTSKTTNISQVKNRPPYQPAFDYYKPLREHIIEIHQTGSGKNSFLQPSQITNDPKKWNNYRDIINGYLKFWGRKSIQWFDPPRQNWSCNNVNILLNPELGIIINNVPHVIKLYMKADKLSKIRVDISLFLMHQSLPAAFNNQPIIYSILDVRQSNLFIPTAFPQNILYTLQAETAYINAIWPYV